DSGIRKLLEIFPKHQDAGLATEVLIEKALDNNVVGQIEENNIQVENHINTMSNSLEQVKATLEPIIQERQTDTDLENLRQLLNAGDIEYLINVVVGYNIVVKVEDQGILIRDRIYQKWDKKATKALVKAIQRAKQEQTSTSRQSITTKGEKSAATWSGDVYQKNN
ncbi:MAG: hypothetical protein F6K17_40470, partial [Okeania sp. SIO3C4]|nr:hypothetical protein [Okeania sp. SIO3C4]